MGLPAYSRNALYLSTIAGEVINARASSLVKKADAAFSSEGRGTPPFARHIKSSMILVGTSLTPLYPGCLQVFEEIQNTSPTSTSIPVSSNISLFTASITFSPTSTCPPGNTHPPWYVFTKRISFLSLITIPAPAMICVGITHAECSISHTLTLHKSRFAGKYSFNWPAPLLPSPRLNVGVDAPRAVVLHGDVLPAEGVLRNLREHPFPLFAPVDGTDEHTVLLHEGEPRDR